MMKKRDRDHKSLWSSITVINENQDDKVFHLDSKGRLIEKFPKHKPRKDLYDKEFIESLGRADQNDQIGITIEDSVFDGPPLGGDDYFDLEFGFTNNADEFSIGYFPDLDGQFDLDCPFDF